MISDEDKWASGDLSKILRQFHQLEVSSIMMADIWDMCYVTPDASIEEVFTLLSTRKHVWVVHGKKSMKLLGLITERDLVDVIAPRKIDPYNFSWSPSSLRSLIFGGIEKAGDIMTTDLVKVTPTDTMGDALLKMKKHHLKRVPVVDKGRLVGEVTIKSIIIRFKKVMRWNTIIKENVSRSPDPK
ncbi:MAG: CBS domain-containing protein [Candidatus Thermoplasmatota archaeon]|jgi:CBS domain-containing protein|nr:CBS domain-containing protein [Candidatus Thermoplasmatota archaeon]